ncbi:MAG: hypothetical protein M1822_004837 [Bathelium mastoideum]|nr:MAG: hypothetical protein M1822_004837 [Bathelium mastoideum]
MESHSTEVTAASAKSPKEVESTSLVPEVMLHVESQDLELKTTGLPPTILREILFLFAVCCAQVLAQAGFAQGLAPANIIAQGFSTENPTQISWFSAAYNLTLGTFILIAGRLGDIYGRKCLLVLGYIWLAISSLLAGSSVWSRSIIFFDVCRALQGIGSAICLPNALGILGQVYTSGARKNIAFAIFGACAPNGFLISAVFSTLLAQLSWWPWAYWTTSIVCACLVVFSMLFVPKLPRHPNDGTHTSSKRLEILACCTGVTGLVLLNISWNQAAVAGWGEPYIIVLLLLGIISICGFVWIERTSDADLIIPVKNMPRHAVFVLLILGLGWSSFGEALFYYFQFVQELRHVTPLGTVAQMTPICLSGLLAAMLAGFLLSRVHASFILVFASLAFCAGNVIVATMPVHQSYWKQALWVHVLMPFGMDMSFPAAAVTISNLVPANRQGIAGSLITTVVNYSMSIGFGIAGTVVSQVGTSDQDLLPKIRGAWYAGIGLSGCGVLLAVYFAFEHRKSTSA